MNKKTVNRAKTIQKKTPTKPVKKAPIVKKTTKTVAKIQAKKKFHFWDLSIYVYWFIILFFIGATFYILGARDMIMSGNVNSELREEQLLSTSDYIKSGEVKFKAGDLDAAIADFSTALKTENPSADVFVMRGSAYAGLGELNMARADFDTAVALDSLNGLAFYNRALLFIQTENYTAALADINNTLAANAVNPNELLAMRDIYAKRGQLNLWLKNWAGAVADYTNSLAHQSGGVSANVYAERGEAYTALNEFDLAIADYTSAVRVISEQIAGVSKTEDREELSRFAMLYFQKIAALNVATGDMVSARENLESAYIIATALNDKEMVQSLSFLILELH